jgi:hypothetical protein
LGGRRVDFDYPIAPVDHISFRSDEDVISMQQEDLFLSRLFRRVAIETQISPQTELLLRKFIPQPALAACHPAYHPRCPLRQKERQRYSLRRATIGSTFMALRAGTRAAIMATVLSSAPANNSAAVLFP